MEGETREPAGRVRVFFFILWPNGVASANEFNDGLSGSAGKKNLSDAGLLQGGDIGFGNDAADEDGHVVHAFFAQEFHELRADGVVRAGEDGEADDVDVFLDGGGGDHLGGLAESDRKRRLNSSNVSESRM